MKLDHEGWAEVRRVWERDPRTGYAWLIDALNLPVSRQAVSARAGRDGWSKREAIKPDPVGDYLHGPRVPGSDYRPAFVKLAANFAKLGLNRQQIAAEFGTDLDGLTQWEQEHPKLAAAIDSGGLIADAEVAAQLLRCATGYQYTTEQAEVIDGKLVAVPVTVTVPPDPAAATFWMQSRLERLLPFAERHDEGADDDQ